jgi:lipid-A-disaccharide synthase
MVPSINSRGQKRILIVTGESSGDLHGANLIRATQTLCPECHFFGVGGSRMAAAGCDLLIRGEELAVMGLIEVIGHFPAIRRALKRLSAILRGPEPPAALVLIDFPEFNLRLAKIAKRAGVPVLYYVSPKVWVWRRGRVKQIAATVDRLAVIFPFEPELYRGLDLLVEYVGHPLLDEYREPVARQTFLGKLGIDPGATVVGIFPGSRDNELRYNFDLLLATAELVKQQRPETVFLLPVAPSFSREQLAGKLAGYDLSVTMVEDDIYTTANACAAILAVSGTVTLQIALVGTPMAIVYRAAPLTYAIGRHLVKVPFIGLPNIVLGEGVVQEFIQDAAVAGTLAGEILRILDDPDYSRMIRDGLA